MNIGLRGLTWNIVLAFLDDILVMGKSFKDHWNNLQIVFDRFRQYGLKLNATKCLLFQKEVEFLGRKVNKTGLAIGDQYIEAVKNWKTPATAKEIEKFLGFANYHRTPLKAMPRWHPP